MNSNRQPALLVKLLLTLITLHLLGACVISVNTQPLQEEELDLSSTVLSANRHFSASYTPSAQPIPINQLHSWLLHLETPDGHPIEGAVIQVDGDMPEHRHGLPTQPAVTAYLGDGTYLVEGVKFQMGGWWVMDFTIEASGVIDTVRFNFILH